MFYEFDLVFTVDLTSIVLGVAGFVGTAIVIGQGNFHQRLKNAGFRSKLGLKYTSTIRTYNIPLGIYI